MPEDTRPVVEPLAVPDIFVSELHCVEDIGGGCLRFTFVTHQRNLIDGSKERAVSLRFIMPAAALPNGIAKSAAAIGWAPAFEIEDYRRTKNAH